MALASLISKDCNLTNNKQVFMMESELLGTTGAIAMVLFVVGMRLSICSLAFHSHIFSSETKE